MSTTSCWKGRLDLSRAEQAKRSMVDSDPPRPLKAMRLKCLECSGDSWREVQLCQVFDCPLWSYRLGRRPTTATQRSPEWLDPLHVAMEGHRQGLRESGYDEWINPQTGRRESILSNQNATGAGVWPDSVDLPTPGTTEAISEADRTQEGGAA